MVLHLQELDLVDLECVCFLSACESAGASILRVSPQVDVTADELTMFARALSSAAD